MESVKRLLEAVDEWIPDPVREVDKPFLLPVEGIYSIPGRGTVVTGRVERGQMRKGDAAEFVGLKSQIKTTITGEECLAASWFSLLPPSIRLPSLSSFPPPSDLLPFLPVPLCLSSSVPAGLQTFHQSLEAGEAGDQLGALVRGVKRESVKRGMVLCAPGTVTSHTQLKGQVCWELVHTRPLSMVSIM